MTASKKTKAELIAENEALRSRVAELERNGKQVPSMHPGSAEDVERGECIERLKGILATIPHGVVQIDTAGTVLYGNRTYHKILGYGDGELIGTSLLDRTESKEERKSLSDFFSMMAKDQPPPKPYFTTRRTKVGRSIELQVDWNYKRDKEDNLVGFTTVLTDITERKRAEEELRESEARFRNLIDTSLQGIYIHKNHRFLYVNQAFADVLGYADPQEVMEIKDVFQFYSPDEHKRLLKYYEARKTGGEAPSRYEYRGLRKDGSPIWLENFVQMVSWKGEPAAMGIAVDLSERKRAEEELRKSKERISAIANSVPVLITYVDQQHRFQFNNNTYADWFGKEPEEFTGKHLREVLGNEAYEIALPHVKGALAGEEQDFEAEVSYKDAGKRFVKAHYVPHFGDNNEVLGFYAAILDLTERKRAEEEVHNSQRLLQTILDTVPHWIFVKDQEGRFKVVNRSMADFFQSQPEEFVNKKLRDFATNNDEISASEKSDRVVIETNEIMEIPNRQSVAGDGSTKTRHVIKLPLRNDDGNAIGIVGISEDITERKQAEEALQESEKNFRAVADNSPSQIVLKNLEGRYIMVNHRFEEVHGISSKDVVGRTIPEVFSGEYGRQVMEQEQEVVRTGEVIERELEVPLPDGSKLISINTKFPVFDDQGLITGVGTIGTNVSDRKNLEEQLRQSQKFEALGTLAGGIAHDFNNMLQPIIGFCELLMNKFGPEKEEHDYLAIISRSAHRAKDLVSQILLFSRRGQTAKRDCELGSVAREVAKLLRSTLPKSIFVTARVSVNLEPVFCDPSQIHQVLLNLCVNAGQAMPDVGKLSITVSNVELDRFECFAGTILSGYYVRLAVSDSGDGMDAETLSQIFDPFFTTKEVGEGTGLGLSTVFGIVRDHNGGITVSSEPGEGSTFAVFLPEAKSKRKSREPQASETKVSKSSETILFVDDEEVIVALGKTALEGHGYDVTVSTDARQALKKFKANPNRFDLVVTDQGMPHLRGDQLAAEMRKTRADIPIILCTGYSETMNPEISKAIGINAFLYKPNEPQELRRVVRAVLDEAQQADRSKNGRKGRVKKIT